MYPSLFFGEPSRAELFTQRAEPSRALWFQKPSQNEPVFSKLCRHRYKSHDRGAETFGDMRTYPNHILKQSLENVLFLNIVPIKFKTEL